MPFYAKKMWYASIGAHWLLNAIVFATPLTFFFVALNIGNTIYSVLFNKFWAHGNFFLVMNWFFMISQTLVTIPLLYEIQFVLKILRPLRVVALGAAMFYNFLWFGALSDLFWLYFGESKQDFDDPKGFLDMFLQLFLSYSLITCIPNLIVNTMIIVKEIGFVIFQLIMNRKAPSE